MDNQLTIQFKRARGASVPLLVIETQDPQNTVRTLANINGAAMMTWDIMRGLSPANQAAIVIVDDICDGQDPIIATSNPAEMLSKITALNDREIVCMYNVQRYLVGDNAASVVQGIANLRNIFKGNGCTLVLLTYGAYLPQELTQDVIVIEDPLPEIEEITTIVENIRQAAAIPELADADKIANMLVGLSAFSAEQVLAMSVYKNDKGIPDIERDTLKKRIKKEIEQTKGLTQNEDEENIDDIKGCDVVLDFLKRMIPGYNAVLLIDELDKQFAGLAGDSSGVSQDQNGAFLSWTQDKNLKGCIFIGVNGAAKSASVKAIARYAGIPCFTMDMGAMRDKYVGTTGQNQRAAQNKVYAISQGKLLIIATCNKIGVLPPELRRRFKRGTFFFDTLTAEAQAVLWPVYQVKYGLDVQAIDFVTTDWTGSEVRNCCEMASELGMTLKEASAYIVPTATSAREEIEVLRTQSSGKFLSASYPGPYHKKIATAEKGRAINLNV